MELKQYFSFKNYDDINDIMFLSPFLLMIFFEMILWCDQRSLPVVITNAVNEKIDGISASDTHKEGRAVDLSVNGWTKDEIYELTEYFNSKYGDDYGTSSNGLNPKVVVYHKGTAFHFHIQVRRGLTELTGDKYVY